MSSKLDSEIYFVFQDELEGCNQPYGNISEPIHSEVWYVLEMSEKLDGRKKFLFGLIFG